MLLAANLFVAISKILVGFVINSSSVMADGFHSISDSASNIVGIIGITLASKPKDTEHPYGHKKFETISSITIGIMLLILGFNVIKTSITKLFEPAVLNITIKSLAIILITLVINIFVAIYENKQGNNLNSRLLIADSLHTKSDVYVSIGVLVTLICIKLGFPVIIDKVVSFVVGIFILHGAYEIFKSTIKILVDGAIIEENVIREIVVEFKEIKDIKNIRSRGSENDIHIDMDIMVEPDMTVEKSHELSHSIENTMRAKINQNIQVATHIEPFKK